MVLVAHNELGHDTEEVEDEEGVTVERCSLYPGLVCRDHLGAAVDVDNARDEDLVPVPFVELCPNSWLVTPARQVVRIPEKDQFVAQEVKRQAKAMQKELGEALPVKTWEDVRGRLAKATEAVDGEAWRQALETLAALEGDVAKPSASFRGLIEALVTAVDEAVELYAEDVFDAEAVGARERAEAERLLRAVDVEVYGARPPIHARLAAWLRDHR